MVNKKLILVQFSRALVPVMVMFFHLSLTMMEYFQFNLFGFSFIPMSGGVNYFFVLSGFMMYYIYRKKFGQTDQMKKFLFNRFIRIYPLYWILTLVLLPFLLIYPWYGAGHETEVETIISSFLLSPNPSDYPPVIIPAWSLKYTVLFYLVFSLLFLPKVLLSKSLIVIWGIASVFYNYGNFPVYNFITDFIFSQETLLFLAGILAAYLVTHFTYKAVGLFLTVIGLLGFPFMWLNSIFHIVNINFNLGTGLASFFLIWGIAAIDLQKEIQIPKSLDYLGNAAFSIYLSHNLALDFFVEMFSRFSVYETIGGWVVSVLLFVIMLGFGCFVHSYIEKPILRVLQNIYSKKSTVVKNVSSTT